MTITKKIGRACGKNFMVITVELREDHEELSGGFSVTADLYEPRGTWSGKARYENGKEPDSCGALHEEILKYAPELAPVIAVHLADPTGAPMHAVANSWYFYSGGAREYEQRKVAEGHIYYAENYKISDHDRAARALNIPSADLPTGLDKAGFEAFAGSLADRWAKQAADARAIIESL